MPCRNINKEHGPTDGNATPIITLSTMLDLSKDFDAVASKLFKSNDYIYAMNSLGYSLLFYELI